MSVDDSEESKGGAIAGLVGRTTSLSIGIASPDSMTDSKVEAAKSPVLSHSPATDGLPSPTVNPNLAPGQVQGVAESAGQTLVVQLTGTSGRLSSTKDQPQLLGPAPKSLQLPSRGGIPQTIRGVIWQVLASSKNEELELVYHDLLNRGTNIDGKDVSSPTTINGAVNGSLKESVASSSSSVHSETSTPATSANIGVVSPSPSHDAADPVNGAKLHAKLTGRAPKEGQGRCSVVVEAREDDQARYGSSDELLEVCCGCGLPRRSLQCLQGVCAV